MFTQPQNFIIQLREQVSKQRVIHQIDRTSTHVSFNNFCELVFVWTQENVIEASCDSRLILQFYCARCSLWIFWAISYRKNFKFPCCRELLPRIVPNLLKYVIFSYFTHALPLWNMPCDCSNLKLLFQLNMKI